MRALRVTAIALGIVIALAAAVVFAVDVIAFVDPVSAKASDDNDPFGHPPSRSSIALQSLLTLVIGFLSVGMAVHHARRLV